MQHRFGLIVGGVPGGDPASAGLARDVGEPVVANRAGGGLQVVAALGSMCGDVDPLATVAEVRCPFGLQASVQGGDESLVGIAVATAETMVEVSDDERDMGGTDGEQGAQQGHAIWAAGDRDDARRLDRAQEAADLFDQFVPCAHVGSLHSLRAPRAVEYSTAPGTIPFEVAPRKTAADALWRDVIEHPEDD